MKFFSIEEKKNKIVVERKERSGQFFFLGEIIAWLYADENDPEKRERNDDADKNMGKLMEQYVYEFEMKLGIRHTRQLWRAYICLE